jgi:hypothetical protein
MPLAWCKGMDTHTIPPQFKNNNPDEVQHDLPPGRDRQTPEVEPEEPGGRASRGVTPETTRPRADMDVTATPPRDESCEREDQVSPHRPRRTTM